MEQKDIELIKRSNISAVTILDLEYPNSLKACYKPPFVLFYKGDISLLNSESIAVVGSRYPSEYAIKATKYIMEGLFSKKDITIISGLAYGIDTIAHIEALHHNQKTIAVLGCGIESCYPKENINLKKEIENIGLVISEYPFKCQCKKENFRMRNRIISALSKGVLVTSAQSKSGTRITVNYALEQGKNIFTIPYSIFEESYCNELLKLGAIPICNGEDLLENL